MVDTKENNTVKVNSLENKTKQNKTKQNKTKQNKTKHWRLRQLAQVGDVSKRCPQFWAMSKVTAIWGSS